MKAKIFLSMTLLVMLVLSACLPGGSLSEEAQQETQIAEIVQQTRVAQAVAQTLTAQAGGMQPVEVVPPGAGQVTVTVSMSTYCRSGPGEPFDILGTLNVGETAEVIGRNEYGDTWIIKLPSDPTITCWLWGYYATVTGDTAGLTVYPNPATPTPQADFTVTYSNHVFCPVVFHVLEFRVTNTGSVRWESLQLNLTNLATMVTVTYTKNAFRDIADDCSTVEDNGSLGPGETGMTGNLDSTALNYSPVGIPFSATLMLCSQDYLEGLCMEKTITFTP